MATGKDRTNCAPAGRWAFALLIALLLLDIAGGMYVRHQQTFEPIPADLDIDPLLDELDALTASVSASVGQTPPLSELETLEERQEQLAAMLEQEARDQEAAVEKNGEQPENTFSAAGGSLRLTGIMTGEKAARALVNGKLLRVGDTVAGVTVVEIKKDSVVFVDPRGVTKEIKVREPAPLL